MSNQIMSTEKIGEIMNNIKIIMIIITYSFSVRHKAQFELACVSHNQIRSKFADKVDLIPMLLVAE